MQISDTTNLQGLLQEIDDNCSTDVNKYPTADKIRNINIEYDNVVAFIKQNSKDIKWADTTLATPYNFKDYDLVLGNKTINIDKPNNTERIEVKDSRGNYTKLNIINTRDIDGALQNFMPVDGVPNSVSIAGDSLTLYPTPDYSQTNSLRIYESPEVTLFTVTDTTEEPDIPRIAHTILSSYASYKYCRKHLPERKADLKQDIAIGYDNLKNYLAGIYTNNDVLTTEDSNFL